MAFGYSFLSLKGLRETLRKRKEKERNAAHVQQAVKLHIHGESFRKGAAHYMDRMKESM